MGPAGPRLGEFRIKRYVPGGQDEFRTHVDISDALRSRRMLVTFWYLNDVAIGGETEFVTLETAVKTKCGRQFDFSADFHVSARWPPPSATRSISSAATCST